MLKSKRTLYPFILPALIVVISALLVWTWPGLIKKAISFKEIKALLIVLPLLPYLVCLIVALMGCRYHNAGLILLSLAVALCYFVLTRYHFPAPRQKWFGFSFFHAAVFLFPLNLALFSSMTKRRILTAAFAGCFAVLLFQILTMALLCNQPGTVTGPLLVYGKKRFPLFYEHGIKIADGLAAFLGSGMPTVLNLPLPAFIAFAGAFLFLVVRFLLSRDALNAGFLGTLVVVFLAVAPFQNDHSAMIYFTAAGLILIITAIESSFFMAYVDELTGLQGRRALNEALINLGGKYAIAMIDVDHFKKFNDTYGHKTGDQVLRMIASLLAQISGGAKTYRYGGEEFAAIFQGKSVREAQLYLEMYRETVAATPFTVRSRNRRKGNPKNRGKQSSSNQKQVQVTVSIGVASPDKQRSTPEAVLKAADQILYKAKKAGRNRVMI